MSCRLQLTMFSLRLGMRRVWVFLAGLLVLFLFNEGLIYLLALLQCTWPQLQVQDADFTVPASDSSPLRAMLLADTHLLGSREGHWFDQLRREWQMQRAFQTAMVVHSPDVIFLLGDVFDEGKWASQEEFESTVARYRRIFSIPAHTEMHVVAGNHDIGFHYMARASLVKRFEREMESPSVRLIHIRDSVFVLVNSIAMEGDSCELCAKAEQQLAQIAKSLQCAKGKSENAQCSKEQPFTYSRPILLQHYPMYRPSDSNCTGPDAAEGQEKHKHMRERWDCLSKQASNTLLSQLNPRLIFSAHTHNGCFLRHPPDGIPEWTIASFNWRNRNNPVFFLATISNNNFAVEKCFLPQESTVISIYITGGVLLAIYLLFPRKLLFSSTPRKRQ